MLVVKCSGSPREVGKQHGTAATTHIARCIDFYTSMFHQTSSLAWKDVLSLAEGFAGNIKSTWPEYFEEMEGIAEGAGQSTLDIVALNVRTEIAFGLFSDGCTSLSWQTREHSFLAQNWDWLPPQKQNLVALEIAQEGKPTISMITEAGIIGKIGFNSAGVGVCLNAIRAKGVDMSRIPVHLALRKALESSSATEAMQTLTTIGVAASAHILVADTSVSLGGEFTSTTSAVIPVDGKGRVAHSNHLLLEHPAVVDTCWLKDSPFRVERVLKLSEELGDGEPSWEGISGLFVDRVNEPAAICRTGDLETVFNIVMDLKARKAIVKVGLPSQPEEVVELGFDSR
ncbi:acyl-coenzyme A:6-aminopenicillanic acid acyl-transferase-domain-containing protein [Aspergillus karnatakaensis]|uniref:putative acyl-CoA:6-aminopenicillanic-acid-acyltransferase n=1 Tax=Aspergillus karnatakaensis TaxID=1810916 RepID=UPI003CCD022C